MRRLISTLLSITSIAVAVSSFAVDEPHPARRLIPENNGTVNIMEMVSPPRWVELSQQLQTALREHGDWIIEYTKENAKPGEVLPYHPNFGITKAEYAEFLELNNSMRLAAASQTALGVREGPSGVFTLDGGSHLPDLTGVVIDLQRDLVKTPLGVARERGTVEASEGQRVTGPWSGISWRREDLDEATMRGSVIKFYLGEMVETGLGILYYDAKRLTDDGLEKATVVITFSLSDEMN